MLSFETIAIFSVAFMYPMEEIKEDLVFFRSVKELEAAWRIGKDTAFAIFFGVLIRDFSISEILKEIKDERVKFCFREAIEMFGNEIEYERFAFRMPSTAENGYFVRAKMSSLEMRKLILRIRAYQIMQGVKTIEEFESD